MKICSLCGYENEGKHPSFCTKCRNEKYFEKHAKICGICKQRFLSRGTKTHCSNKCNILGNTEKTESNCWEWKKGCNEFGYGICEDEKSGKLISLHRLSFKIFRGEIPKGKFVCHTCDNPKCCNPSHLWLGNCKENMEDCANKKRTYRPLGEKHYSSTLTEEQVKSIRNEYNQGISRKELAIKYEQNLENIHKIIQRKSWKHLL